MAERFAQHVGAVGPLGDALDGSPVKRKRSAKKANPNSEVTTSAVCYCGQWFDDFRDAFLHARNDCEEFVRIDELRRRDGSRLIAKCGSLGGYHRHYMQGESPCEACEDAKRRYQRDRWADVDYRQKRTSQIRQRRQDPAVRERQRERDRANRQDPQWLARRREWEQQRRADPVIGEQLRAKARDYYARKQAEKGAAIRGSGDGT